MAKKADTAKAKARQLEKALKEEHASRLRLAAEYENFRKRAKQLGQDAAGRAVSDLLERLFPIFENFYRASAHAPNISLEDIPKLSQDDLKRLANYFAGLKMIEGQMEAVLKEAGLTKIQTTGARFDPNLHEAVSYEENSSVAPEYIISEVESGWMIDGKVVKPAKVRVAKG